MSNSCKHKRYYRIKVATTNGGAFDTDYVFANVADANSKIGFKSVFDTSSPTKTEALEDSDKTLVVTYEFESESAQDAFKSAIDTAYESGSIFTGDNSTHSKVDLGIDAPAGVNNLMIKVEHFKTEWLHPDGSISATTNL